MRVLFVVATILVIATLVEGKCCRLTGRYARCSDIDATACARRGGGTFIDTGSCSSSPCCTELGGGNWVTRANDPECCELNGGVVGSCPVCGDGIVGFNEECDDGNVNSDDGCSASCRIEGKCCRQNGDGPPRCSTSTSDTCSLLGGTFIANVTCVAEPCCVQVEGVHTDRNLDPECCTLNGGVVGSCPVCGDGIVGFNEECDDNNTFNGDGCSAVCETEFAAVFPCCSTNVSAGSTCIELPTPSACVAPDVPGLTNTSCSLPVPCCTPDYGTLMLDPACCNNTFFRGTLGECPFACCAPDEVCIDVENSTSCDALGPIYHPNNVGNVPCGTYEPCCTHTGTKMVSPACCTHPIENGVPGTCLPQPCCFPNGTCAEVVAENDCTGVGGTLTAQNDTCTQPQPCCLPGVEGTQILDPSCCVASGGTVGNCTFACCYPENCGNTLDATSCSSLGPIYYPNLDNGTCTEPQPCCGPTFGTSLRDPACCTHPIENGVVGECLPQPCCTATGQCSTVVDVAMCTNKGGVIQASNGTCAGFSPCCTPSGEQYVDINCCGHIGGTVGPC